MSRDTLPRKIEVMAHSGYKANERPLYFVFDGLRLEVRDVIDRWYGVEHDYYKVLASDAKIYLLRWHRILDLWFVVKIMERLGRH